MWPNRVSSPRPLVLESDALPTALRDPAKAKKEKDRRIAIFENELYV